MLSRLKLSLSSHMSLRRLSYLSSMLDSIQQVIFDIYHNILKCYTYTKVNRIFNEFTYTLHTASTNNLHLEFPFHPLVFFIIYILVILKCLKQITDTVIVYSVSTSYYLYEYQQYIKIHNH